MKNIDSGNVRNWKLKKIRVDAGITQEVIAEYLNMKRTAYQYLETKGKLTDDVLVKLSRFFDRPYEDFLPDDEIVKEPIKGGRLNEPDKVVVVDHIVLSDIERELLYTFKDLTNENKYDIIRYLRIIDQNQKNQNKY